MARWWPGAPPTGAVHPGKRLDLVEAEQGGVLDELPEVAVHPSCGRLAKRPTGLAGQTAPQRDLHLLGWIAARLAPVLRHPGAPGKAAERAVDRRRRDALVLDAHSAPDDLATLGEVVVPEQVRQPLLDAGRSSQAAFSRRDEVVDDARLAGAACELDQLARNHTVLGIFGVRVEPRRDAVGEQIGGKQPRVAATGSPQRI